MSRREFDDTDEEFETPLRAIQRLRQQIVQSLFDATLEDLLGEYPHPGHQQMILEGLRPLGNKDASSPLLAADDYSRWYRDEFGIELTDVRFHEVAFAYAARTGEAGRQIPGLISLWGRPVIDDAA